MNAQRTKVLARLHHRLVRESQTTNPRTREITACDPITGSRIVRCMPEFGDDYYPPEIPMDECPHGHGQQRIVDAGGNSGFVGEGVWWADLACGHQVVEMGEVQDWMIR